jgi:hypothetical protein
MASSVSDLDKSNDPPVEEGRKTEPPGAAPNPKRRLLLIGAVLVAVAVGAWFT